MVAILLESQCAVPRHRSGQRRRRTSHRVESGRCGAKHPPASPKVEPEVAFADDMPRTPPPKGFRHGCDDIHQTPEKVAPTEAPCQEELPAAMETRRVHMDPAPHIVHEIMPYAELYGLHPSGFVFDRHYNMLPAIGGADVGTAWKRWRQKMAVTDDEVDSENDSEDSTNEWDLEYSISL